MTSINKKITENSPARGKNGLQTKNIKQTTDTAARKNPPQLKPPRSLNEVRNGTKAGKKTRTKKINSTLFLGKAFRIVDINSNLLSIYIQ
ncbi:MULTISPECIES: hypothetical protein [Marinobacter]|uniref:hypothetical protein n=1 Tax=Marinobacter sp. KM021 TaxID=3075616 RepID=UPI003D6AEDA4